MKNWLAVLFIILGWGLLGGLPTQAAQVFLLATGNVNDETIGEFTQEGISVVQQLFGRNLPENMLVVYNHGWHGAPSAWTGPDLVKSSKPFDDLLAAIASCPATPDDSLVVFWMGYRSWLGDECFLNQSSSQSPSETNKLSRQKLAAAIQAKQTRMAALFTESGKIFRRYDAPKRSYGAPNTDKVSILMNALFFQTRGFVDLNSAERTQNPMLMNAYGGAFVEVLVEIIEKLDYKQMDWSEFVSKANMLLEHDFPGKKQNIEVWSLPGNTTAQADFPAAHTPDVTKDTGKKAGSQNKISKVIPKSDLFKDTAASAETKTEPASRQHDTTSRRTTTSHKSRMASSTTSQQFQRRTGNWNSDAYTANWNQRINERQAENYPDDYFATTGMQSPNTWSGTMWSAPVYHPERGDYLLAINGMPVYNYAGFLNAIQQSPSIIYLTFADYRSGHVYEMRTSLAPAMGQKIRLGLYVVNSPLAGVQVTGTALGSPASRCQYRLGYLDFSYPVPEYRYGIRPIPVPVPIPDPQPIPGPIPVPTPGPQPYHPPVDPIYGPIDPVPNPNPNNDVADPDSP